MVDLPIVGDAGSVLEDLLAAWQARQLQLAQTALKAWWQKIDEWRARDCLKFDQRGEAIKPQHAFQRLSELPRPRTPLISTEVGQNQMLAAQYIPEAPPVGKECVYPFPNSWWPFHLKQKSDYEMRISDWSSDVCSSDLLAAWQARKLQLDQKALKAWWQKIDEWRARDCLKFEQRGEASKPQHAI